MNTSKKVAIGSISGVIVGLLVMKGYIAPIDAGAATQNLDTLAGAILAIVSVIGFFEHHAKNPNQAATTAQATTTTAATEVVTPPVETPPAQ